MIVPLEELCWAGRHETGVGMSRNFLLESHEDGGGRGQTVLHPLVRAWVSCPLCGVRSRRIHSEPFSKALGRYAQQTQRTRGSLLELSHCGSVQMAARVARILGFVTSLDSLLRLQRFPAIFLRVLGVDEFALRKGRFYGTLMVDLERRIPVTFLRAS